MSGGDPTAIHAAQHVAPAPLRAVPCITPISAAEAFRSHGADGGGVSSLDPAAISFWQRVNNGAERLSPEEDALVWSLRGAGLTFDEIADAVAARRRTQREAIVFARRSAAVTRSNHERWARKWREDYRRERGL